MPEVRDGGFQQFPQSALLFVLRFLLGSLGLQFDAGSLGQLPERFGKIPALFLHYETEYITTFVAGAKATPGAAVWKDRKGRRARIRMEGAKTGIILARLPQLDAFADDLDDIEPVLDFVDYTH